MNDVREIYDQFIRRSSSHENFFDHRSSIKLKQKMLSEKTSIFFKRV